MISSGRGHHRQVDPRQTSHYQTFNDDDNGDVPPESSVTSPDR